MRKKFFVVIYCFMYLFKLSGEDFSLEGFTNKIHKKNEWIPIEYIQVINAKDRNKLKDIIFDYNFERVYDDSCEQWFEWYENYNIENLYYDDYIGLDGKRYKFVFFDNEWFYSIKKIETNLNIFLHQGISSIFNTNMKVFQTGKITPLKNLRKAPLYSENPSYYNEEEYKFDEIIIDTKFIFDGDYLTVYANEDKFKQVYFRCTEETFEQLKSLIYTNKIDLSKVTWPRHADGSCDYDGSKKSAASKTVKAISTTKVTPNKTMTVKENLKLRSGEATSTQVLTVMSAGTKVKILALGKSETIDGINSNWVKVEVQTGAKDRDGKPIKAGTVGWCYGGCKLIKMKLKQKSKYLLNLIISKN